MDKPIKILFVFLFLIVLSGCEDVLFNDSNEAPVISGIDTLTFTID